jgi:transaldolase/glucose-6-phosphate isomerase
MSHPIKQVNELGQSVWLDLIRRGYIESGDFQRMIEEDGLSGVTSNPAIFEKAISGSNDYQQALQRLIESGETDAKTLYEHLAVEDIQTTADIFRPVYEQADRRDGYVSLEVSPHLSRDTQGTLDEARRLWRWIDRPNAMIKVPATPEGIEAIQQLLSEGINVNVTLLFSRDLYAQTLEAYMKALENRIDRGEPVDHVASVASFFISRIDGAIERAAKQRRESGQKDQADQLDVLIGRASVAHAQLAYQHFAEVLESERGQRLAQAGAMPQRLLWASTSPKHPALSETYYLDRLIGPETVTTVPPKTYDAFLKEGVATRTVDTDLATAHETVAAVEAAGLDWDALTDEVLREGESLFAEAFDRLLCAVDGVREASTNGAVTSGGQSLPSEMETAVGEAIQEWGKANATRRLWSGDRSLWTNADEADWLGWLSATDDPDAVASRYEPLRQLGQSGSFDHVLLLGMGGSSLGPDVLRQVFGHIAGFPELHVLDSTDPRQIQQFESRINLGRTLFIISSKSGTTTESNLLLDYFYHRMRDVAGDQHAGEHFIAITDPGKALEERARDLGFRAVYHGVPSIGGRYSVLSPFGLVPAALMGIDIATLLNRADEMAQACAGCVPAADNPGVNLGASLGTLVNRGYDKLTLMASPSVSSFGSWLEQLLAESTGKASKGLIPIYDEPLTSPQHYSNDRVFVYLYIQGEVDTGHNVTMQRLEESGQPVIRIALRDAYDLGLEFFRWEFATAVAGSLMQLNPFDQPDVEASKIATRQLTQKYEQEGQLSEQSPLSQVEGEPTLRFVTDEANAERLRPALGEDCDPTPLLRALLNQAQKNDYVALLAYVPMDADHHQPLREMRESILNFTQVATCLEYGPRYLHSTGQAYKGGPNEGVFLQITWRNGHDLTIPGRAATFNVVEQAQARGDFQVLAERGRRALRMEILGDSEQGLKRLQRLVDAAVASSRAAAW